MFADSLFIVCYDATDAFLAVMAYQPPNTFQEKLDQWFGPGIAKDEVDIVREFRQRVEGGNAAVSYRLVTFPDVAGAIVTVRGSTTSWEWLTDAQLWSGAAIAQFVRGLMPLGEIFTPIIHQLLKAISVLESDNLDKVSLYKQTTQFVRELQASGNYTWIHITGQSLGGKWSRPDPEQPNVNSASLIIQLCRDSFFTALVGFHVSQTRWYYVDHCCSNRNTWNRHIRSQQHVVAQDL